MAKSTDWQAMMANHAPGDEAEIVTRAYGERKVARIRFAADPGLEVVTYEAAGLPVTDEMRALRAAWLGSRRSSRQP